VYTPSKTRDYERHVANLARQHKPDGWPAGKEDRYRIECVFYLGDRRARDGDNLLKAIQDALQHDAAGPVFLDDKYCIEGEYKVRYDKANPRAEVRVICLTESSSESTSEAKPEALAHCAGSIVSTKGD
jgi:Holliday junction resolvase RusA-like endonuclease